MNHSSSFSFLSEWKKGHHFQKQKDALFLGFSFSFAFLLTLGVNTPLLADMDITIIPTTGALGRAFQTGDFSFELILLFGLHLIKLGATLSGVVYMLMNVYAGFQYIVKASSGDKESASQMMMNAFYGFALAIMSWIFMDIFISFVMS